MRQEAFHCIGLTLKVNVNYIENDNKNIEINNWILRKNASIIPMYKTWREMYMVKKSISRIGLLKQGKRPDRVPISLSLSSYAPKMLEISAEEFYLNPEIAFEANSWVEEMFPADTGIGYTVPDSICLDFGGEVRFGKGCLECPETMRNPVQSEKDLLNLTVPDP